MSHGLGDDTLLYSPEHDIAASLNDSATAIWERCDGTSTIREISRDLAAQVGSAESELFPQVSAAIRRLRELDLLESDEASVVGSE